MERVIPPTVPPGSAAWFEPRMHDHGRPNGQPWFVPSVAVSRVYAPALKVGVWHGA